MAGLLTLTGEFCSRNSTPAEHASAAEVFLPPLLLLLMLFAGLCGLMASDRYWGRKTFTYDTTTLFKIQHIVKKQSRMRTAEGCLNIKDWSNDGNFYSDLDKAVLQSSDTFFNSVRNLLLISMPALASLVMCSVSILLCYPMISCIWPSHTTGPPNINSAITCYLAPAGMIYALSFGFMYNQVLSKQKSISDLVTEQLSMLDQIVTMTTRMNMPTPHHLMAICKAVKAEVVFTMLQTQNRAPEDLGHTDATDLKVEIWSIIDILRDAASHTEYKFKLNALLVENVVNYMLKLNDICSDRMGALHCKIHPLKWAFLEILGVFSLFGVMFLDAKSYHMELAMIELTVFSTSMLCYVLADLDSPFDGFFRVDLSVFPEVLKKIEDSYNEAKVAAVTSQLIKSTEV